MSDTTKHPYFTGNFAPVKTQLPLTRCKLVGAIPDELIGGEYLRNGGNPTAHHDGARPAHWFDVRCDDTLVALTKS